MNGSENNGSCTLCGRTGCDLTAVDEFTFVCDECLEQEFFCCDDCGEYWSYDEMEFYHLKDGRTICENCREDHDDDEIADD